MGATLKSRERTGPEVRLRNPGGPESHYSCGSEPLRLAPVTTQVTPCRRVVASVTFATVGSRSREPIAAGHTSRCEARQRPGGTKTRPMRAGEGRRAAGAHPVQGSPEEPTRGRRTELRTWRAVLSAINITLDGLEETVRALVREEIKRLKVEAEHELLDIDGCVAYTGWTKQTIYDLRSDGVLKRRGMRGGKVLHNRFMCVAALPDASSRFHLRRLQRRSVRGLRRS